MNAYPAQYESDYVPERSRVTTFFRMLMVIPHCFLGFAYGIAACFSLVIAWFAVVFTGRYPEGLYNFHAGLLRWVTQLYGYAFLLTDRFPPFGLTENDYPVRVHIGARQPEYDRVKAFFRLILIIPWAIVIGIYSYVALFATIAAWFAIVVTGRQPDVLQRGVNFYLGPNVKFSAFALMLTDAWPPFEPETALEPRAGGPAPEAPAFQISAPAPDAPPAPPAAPVQSGLSGGDPLNPQ